MRQVFRVMCYFGAQCQVVYVSAECVSDAIRRCLQHGAKRADPFGTSTSGRVDLVA